VGRGGCGGPPAGFIHSKDLREEEMANLMGMDDDEEEDEDDE
jgi:hypothetical protein